MRLHEIIYMKVTNTDKTYYLIYKSYVNKHDGYTNVKEINENRFNIAKDAGFKIEEKDLENARFGIKRRIERGYFEGVKHEVYQML